MASLKNSESPDVPWQRVINAQGKISLHGDGFGNALQRIRLEEEGIEFDQKGQIDFARFGWPGPDERY
jgi:methylated-DNA-protein-cysteine methyltransferase related protein